MDWNILNATYTIHKYVGIKQYSKN